MKKNIHYINKKYMANNDTIFKSNPENIQFLKDIIDDLYPYGLVDEFITFKSINNIFYVIYSDKNKSIISYDLVNYKKIVEIKRAHNERITNFRYNFDSINKRDLIISISGDDNNIKLWNIFNWECLFNYKEINESGFLKSATFIIDNNQLNIITTNYFYGSDISEFIKVFDLKGNKIKELNNSNDNTNFVDVYYDINKIYIITGNRGYCKSFDYIENKIYHKYEDKDNEGHYKVIIKDEDRITKLIESCTDNNIRIWNFHSEELLNKINCYNSFLGLYLWNNDYLFVCCYNKKLELLDLKNEKIIKSLDGHKDFVIDVKKIDIPILGECLLSIDNKGLMKFWGNKN